MTLTFPLDLLHRGEAGEVWDPMLSGHAPGLTLAVTIEDRLRLVVLDVADQSSVDAEALDELKHHCAGRQADDLADDLVAGRSSWHPSCASVAIADLSPDGQLQLRMRNAPSAVLLSPAQPARLLPDTGPTDGCPRVGPGEVLLLCSASFLEEPPPALGAVRRSLFTDSGLTRLRRSLQNASHPGATASVARRTN